MEWRTESTKFKIKKGKKKRKKLTPIDCKAFNLFNNSAKALHGDCCAKTWQHSEDTRLIIHAFFCFFSKRSISFHAPRCNTCASVSSPAMVHPLPCPTAAGRAGAPAAGGLFGVPGGREPAQPPAPPDKKGAERLQPVA